MQIQSVGNEKLLTQYSSGLLDFVFDIAEFGCINKPSYSVRAQKYETLTSRASLLCMNTASSGRTSEFIFPCTYQVTRLVNGKYGPNNTVG